MATLNTSEFLHADFSKQYIASGLANVPGGFFVYKAHGDEELLYANEELLKIFECDTPEQFIELTGGTFKGIVHPDDLNVAENSIWNQIRTGNDNLDHLYYRITTRTGKIKYIEDFGRLYNDPEQGEVFYVFIVDVQSKHQSFDIDALTGLPGMRRFSESGDMMLNSKTLNAGSFDHSLVFFNIRNFKYFNIKYGMSAGDEILKNIASLLLRHFPNNFIFRFSNDHFVVITQTKGILERIEQFHEDVLNLREENKVFIMAGIYNIVSSEISPSMACDLAKAACDEVTGNDDDYYCFYTEALGEKLQRKKYIIDNIDKAISEGYIRPYYQSIIRSSTSAICGKETLARWIDPVYGFLSPAEFIPVLEDSKQLHKLDLYIIERALADNKKRIEQDEPSINFSVNLSRYDFELCDMVEEITKRVKAAGIPPGLLTLEITESVQGIDPDYLKEQIRRFHEAGFKVWMDDFGSGFSSLNVLQDFDFDLIKLDMKFLKGFGTNRKNPVILKKIIEMANDLGIDTLVEGVETKEQARFLKEIGCDKLQGFYYSKPHPFMSGPEVTMDGTPLKYEDKNIELNQLNKKTFNYNQSVDYDYFKLNAYRDIPLPFALYKVILNDEGTEVIDTEYVFVNHKYCELVNKSKDELIGHRFSEKFADTGGDWYPYCYRAAILGEEINTTIFSTETQLWLNFTIAPTSIPNHCAYTFMNIDKEHKDRALFDKMGNTDRAIIRIVETLNKRLPYKPTINAILEEISKVIHPDRLYILETDKKTVDNTFEWCAEGIEPSIQMLQNIPYEGYLDLWEEALGDQNSLVVENIEQYKEKDPQMYEILKVQNIHNLIEAPLFDNDRIIGYLGADNYRVTEEIDTRRILETVSRFIAKRIINYQLMKQLEFINEHDMLTGSLNRYAMLEKTAELEKAGGSVGIVFVDLNGLKATNDHQGHKAGDKVLRKSANFLTDFFGSGKVFRTGGDEFNVILPGITETAFMELTERFMQELHDSPLNMAVGMEWCENAKEIMRAIASADKKMYQDKAEYYIRHDRRKKRN